MDNEDTEHDLPVRIAREAELLDPTDLVVLAPWLASAMASGVIGNATYDVLMTLAGSVRAFFQRKGGLKTEKLAAYTLDALRTARPYEPESALKDQIEQLFAKAGVELDRRALPTSPPAPKPTHGVGPSVTGGAWDPFVAYASPDRLTAIGLHARLAARGLRPFVDSKDIPAGAVWPEELLTAIATSRRFVFLLSRHTAQAWYKTDEVVRAIERIRTKEAQGIPVHLGPRPPTSAGLPYGLAPLQPLSLEELGSLDALADALARVT